MNTERDTERGSNNVVGVDESEQSRLALTNAVEEATRGRAPLRVVTAFESAGRFGARYGVPIPVSDEQIARTEEAAIRKMVDEVLDADEARPEVRIVDTPGATGPVLDQSRTAALLVVGYRGRGAVTGTLLGSVGLFCVLHAHSPVLVVRPVAAHAPTCVMTSGT